MVVFNLLAIPVVVLIALVVMGVNALYPFTGTPYEWFGIGLISAIVGGLCEIFGLAGRIFWIPIWLLGVIFAGYQSYALWGGLGAAIGAGSVVGAIFLIVILARASEKKQWEQAPRKLSEARDCYRTNREEAMWEALGLTYFVPGLITMTPAMYGHDIEVLNFIHEILDTREYPDFVLDVIETLVDMMVEAQSSEERPEGFDENSQFVSDLITNKGALPPEEEED